MLVFIILFTFTLAVSMLPSFIKFDKKAWLNMLLSFSGAFLLGITFLHVVPELFHENNQSVQIGIFVMIGFFLQIFLESYSKGIEHGHIHIHDFGKMPYGLFLALTTHALLEGSALSFEDESTFHIASAILVHKLPVAFLLGVLLFSINTNKIFSIFLLTIFALATPIGGLFSSFLDVVLFNVHIHTILLAMATGSFLHVSTTILFETSPDHKLKINKFLPALLGCLLAILSTNLHLH